MSIVVSSAIGQREKKKKTFEMKEWSYTKLIIQKRRELIKIKTGYPAV